MQALPPKIDFIWLNAKGNMTSSCRAMGWQHSALSSDVRPKKKQDTWTGADLQGSAATAFVRYSALLTNSLNFISRAIASLFATSSPTLTLPSSIELM
jgi:hypothetical protein